MTSPSRARWPWLLLLPILLGGLVWSAVDDPGPVTRAQRSRALGESIKCPTCQGQSVADSDAIAARAIRDQIGVQIDEGRTDGEIRDYFAGRYGDQILLRPGRGGLAGLVWFLPVAGFVVAVAGLAAVFRRWRTAESLSASADDEAVVLAALRSSASPDAGP